MAFVYIRSLMVNSFGHFVAAVKFAVGSLIFCPCDLTICSLGALFISQVLFTRRGGGGGGGVRSRKRTIIIIIIIIIITVI